jgi:hypothetical protein
MAFIYVILKYRWSVTNPYKLSAELENKEFLSVNKYYLFKSLAASSTFPFLTKTVRAIKY